MKITSLFLTLVLCVGCNQTSHTTATAPPAKNQSVTPKPVEPSEDRTRPSTVAFKLTDSARAKVLTAMKSVPNGTHLIVSVDVDDEKYCTGFHYNLGIQADPSDANYVFVDSNGISLAIEKDDVVFLDGTTLDYAVLSSGTEGFVFRNPNARDALPEELRDNERANP